jgi:hypothetical protein
MQLAYFDDSGSDKQSGILAVVALIVPDDQIMNIEILVGTVIDSLIPEDKKESFERFHAHELYCGEGPFSGLDDRDRFDAILKLLEVVGSGDAGSPPLPFVYSAIDKKGLEKSPFRSALATDVAFGMSALGVEEWMLENASDGLCLFLLDEANDKVKKELQASFRALRSQIRPPTWTPNRLWHVHDAVYFGSSKDSVGLQIADLCAYFVRRQLSGQPDPEGFFSVIAKQAICSVIEPEWSQYKGIFVRHSM